VSDTIPTIVLGGTGYVAGELLRLTLGHPQLMLAAVLSDSQPGASVAQAFPHLAPVCGDLVFSSQQQVEAVLQTTARPAIFGAAPHGASAPLIDKLLKVAEAAGNRPAVVDISADFRYRDAAQYQAVYGQPHGAPARLAQFSCAVPEHLATAGTAHVAHPGCFATATLLAAVPLMALGLCEPQLFVAAVTGSTGSGRKPTDGTHHPLRHSDLYAYNPLAHRHVAEICAGVQAAAGLAAQVAFVPHSGPFARGIHATVQAVLKKKQSTDQLNAQLRAFYAHSPFVRVLDAPPRIKDVAGSNYAQLHCVTDGRTVAVLSVLDNLNKGAAGGAVQWMNRLLGLPETAGLTAPAAGWT
jgi:N-acetyl-gamma-glutamyl-phosphate reductase common form